MFLLLANSRSRRAWKPGKVWALCFLLIVVKLMQRGGHKAAVVLEKRLSCTALRFLRISMTHLEFSGLGTCVLCISRAGCLRFNTDDTTRVGALPKYKNIRWPYFLERAWRKRCGSVPSWCRLPMIGSFGGYGGKLGLPLLRGLET